MERLECLDDNQYYLPNQNDANPNRPKVTQASSINRNFEGDISYIFTRHANSCNNQTGALGKVAEPSIVYSEFSKVVQFSRTNELLPVTFDDSVQELDVHVSCLLRTWETAIGLYGPHAKTLNLIVSPYLREKSWQVSRFQLKRLGRQFDKGNYAAPFAHQLQSFQRFLLKVMKLDVGNGDPAIQCSRINLIVYDPESFEGLPVGGGFEIATFIYSPNPQIQWYSHVTSYEFQFPPHFDAFYTNGIELFMRSIKRSRYYTKQYVFAVSHNGVLTKFAKSKPQFRDFGGTHQNVWSFSNVLNHETGKKEWTCYRGLMPSIKLRSLEDDELCKYDKPLSTSFNAPYRAKDILEPVSLEPEPRREQNTRRLSIGSSPALDEQSREENRLSPGPGLSTIEAAEGRGGHRRRSKARKRGIKKSVTRKLF